MKEFLLKAETPSKKNSKVFNTKTHKMFPSANYRAWHEYAALIIKRLVTESVDSKCYIILIFCHGDQRRRDSDNGVSSIFDALVDFNALKDDCWQIVRNHHVFNCYEKGNPWCKVLLFKEEEVELYKAHVKSCLELYL